MDLFIGRTLSSLLYSAAARPKVRPSFSGASVVGATPPRLQIRVLIVSVSCKPPLQLPEVDRRTFVCLVTRYLHVLAPRQLCASPCHHFSWLAQLILFPIENIARFKLLLASCSRYLSGVEHQCPKKRLTIPFQLGKAILISTTQPSRSSQASESM